MVPDAAQPVTRSGNPEKAFAGARERAAITGIRSHGLRHSFASWQVQENYRNRRRRAISGQEVMRGSVVPPPRLERGTSRSTI